MLFGVSGHSLLLWLSNTCRATLFQSHPYLPKGIRVINPPGWRNALSLPPALLVGGMPTLQVGGMSFGGTCICTHRFGNRYSHTGTAIRLIIRDSCSGTRDQEAIPYLHVWAHIWAHILGGPKNTVAFSFSS